MFTELKRIGVLTIGCLVLATFLNAGDNPAGAAGGGQAALLAKHRPLNVRDFGAKGDGKTDDTDAIQRCLLEAGSNDYPFVGYRGYVTAPEVFFPPGTYLVSRTLLVRNCGGRTDDGYNTLYLRGEQATIRQTDPKADILYFRLCYRNVVEGFTFEGGKRQIKLWSNNLDQAHIIIRDCVFRNSSDYAIDDQLRKDPAGANWYTLLEPYRIAWDQRGLPVLTPADESAAPMFGYVSTCMRIGRCSFERCARALSAWADWTFMDESVIETRPGMTGPVIRVGGALMMEDVRGLAHVTPGTKQWWITMDPGKQPCGLVGLDLKNVDFRTDSARGWCAVRNETKFAGGNHVYIIADGCSFQCAGSRENCAIYLVESPNLINVRNCRERSGKKTGILGFQKSFPEDYFHGHCTDVFSFTLAGNRGLVANLPPAMTPFADRPLPEQVARRFDLPPSRITLPRMCAGVSRRLNLLDFGAKCDGSADDSDAFRRAFAAAREDSGYVEVVVPNGLYRLGETVELPPRLVLRGSGQAHFTAPAGKKGPVFTAPDARRLVLANLHFFKCEQGVAIATKPDQPSEILIDGCYFSDNSDCDVVCLSGTGAAGVPNRTSLVVNDCTFSTSNRMLLHNANHALLENNWITTVPNTTNSGVLVNRGLLHVKSLVGVPQCTPANDARWADNYGSVFCDRCRFGGEGGGLPMVVNFASRGYVLLQNSWLMNYAGNPQRPSCVDCAELPDLIAVRGCIGWPTLSPKMVRIRQGTHGDLAGRFFESANTAPGWVKDERVPAGQTRIDLGDGISFDLIRVVPGEFTVGSPAGELGRRDNENQGRIRITKPFLLGKYEVTQAVWQRVMTASIAAPANAAGFYWQHSDVLDISRDPSPSRFAGLQRPVEKVSWRQIKEFIARLNLLVDGGGFRLPTEAEWEYAARAGTDTPYFYGKDPSRLGSFAWFKSDSGGTTHPVGGRRPNPWGFYDLYGNVWELCEDEFTGPYKFPSAAVADDFCARGAESGNAYQTIRGGSCAFSAALCRSAARSGFDAWHWTDDVGFRLARDVK